MAGISANQASFPKGAGPVFLDYVKCYGTESSLLSCFHRVVYYSDVINDCSLSNDAGVVCPSCKYNIQIVLTFLSFCHSVTVLATVNIVMLEF